MLLIESWFGKLRLTSIRDSQTCSIYTKNSHSPLHKVLVLNKNSIFTHVGNACCTACSIDHHSSCGSGLLGYTISDRSDSDNTGSSNSCAFDPISRKDYRF